MRARASAEALYNLSDASADAPARYALLEWLVWRARSGQAVRAREGVNDVSWEAAGAAWGARAGDWASLIDPWTMPVYLDVFDHLGVSEGDDVLDIGCASALTGVELRRRGA